MTKSGFDDSIRKAQLDADAPIIVSAEEYDWLVNQTDEPTAPTPKRRHRELVRQKTVWND